MKKLLVTGISGFLGKELAAYDQTEWKIAGLFYKNKIELPQVDTVGCDIADGDRLKEVFHEIKPDAAIHLAALSNPNYCELNPEESYEINVLATGQIAQLCSELQIPLVFTSTDLVFDGENAPYAETDFSQPLMVYGKHKSLGEEQVRANHGQAVIVRFPVIFGNGGFMKNWIDTLAKGDTINAFTDEYRSTICAGDAIKGLLMFLKKRAFGTWHLGGRERISRYDFALKMASVFKMPAGNIKAALRKQAIMPAARPADVSLDSRKAYQLGFDPLLIDAALNGLVLNK